MIKLNKLYAYLLLASICITTVYSSTNPMDQDGDKAKDSPRGLKRKDHPTDDGASNIDKRPKYTFSAFLRKAQLNVNDQTNRLSELPKPIARRPFTFSQPEANPILKSDNTPSAFIRFNRSIPQINDNQQATIIHQLEWNDLPDELIYKILSHTDLNIIKLRKNFARIDKRFYAIASDLELCSSILKRDFCFDYPSFITFDNHNRPQKIHFDLIQEHYTLMKASLATDGVPRTLAGYNHILNCESRLRELFKDEYVNFRNKILDNLAIAQGVEGRLEDKLNKLWERKEKILFNQIMSQGLANNNIESMMLKRNYHCDGHRGFTNNKSEACKINDQLILLGSYGAAYHKHHSLKNNCYVHKGNKNRKEILRQYYPWYLKATQEEELYYSAIKAQYNSEPRLAKIKCIIQDICSDFKNPNYSERLNNAHNIIKEFGIHLFMPQYRISKELIAEYKRFLEIGLYALNEHK